MCLDDLMAGVQISHLYPLFCNNEDEENSTRTSLL